MNPTTDNSTFFNLSDLGIVRVSGDDAESFLQGQLSNDVSELDLQGHQLTAYCNPKGRMLALFNLLKQADNDYLLLAPREILDKVTPRLKMFVMRAAVNIEAGDDVVYGIRTKDAHSASEGFMADTPVFALSLLA